MNMYDKSSNRNQEPIALGACQRNQGLLLAAAVLIILATFVMFMTRPTRIQPGHVGVEIHLVDGQQGPKTPISVWVAPSLVRVKPSDTPGTTSSISLSGGRGEYVDTQIIVNAPAGGLTNVNMSASNLTGPNGATIAASQVTFYREYYVTVTGSTPEGGTNPPLGSGTYPEPLIPFNDPQTGSPLNGSLKAVPATVTANQNQPFWVDIFVPRGTGSAPPGTYTGTITVTSTQGNVNVPVSLTVWNFELPLKPSELTHFTTTVNTGNPTNAQQQALIRNRIFNMNYSTVQVSSFTSTLGLSRAGLGGAFGWNFVNCNGSLNDAIPSQAAIAAVVATYPRTIPLDLYAADENIGCPNSYANIQLLANHAHPNGVKILDTIPPDTNLYNYVDYWVMLPHNWPGNLAGIPGSFWSYASCNVGSGNSPAWQIDYPPINERMQAGFLNQTQGATGLLYWTVDGWTAGDAIGSWSTPPASGCGVSRPGDGLLIYPPSPIGSTEPAPGIRLKAIRDGIQDYEYVQILKNLGQGAFATSVIQPIATSWNSWTHDPNALSAARVQLGQKLDQLSPA